MSSCEPDGHIGLQRGIDVSGSLARWDGPGPAGLHRCERRRRRFCFCFPSFTSVLNPSIEQLPKPDEQYSGAAQELAASASVKRLH